MKFLIIGGAGAVGRELAALLLEEGCPVRILDRDEEALKVLPEGTESIAGNLEDKNTLQGVLRGIDVVCHLAWSFSDEPEYLLEHDLRGHIYLMEALSTYRIKHFFYTSSAVVYGKPQVTPIREDSPCLIDRARKPVYAAAKQMAENLTLIYGKTNSIPVTIFRFWWSFGERIGGRHLREMMKSALKGDPLSVPEGAGGSFLDHRDLAHALMLAIKSQSRAGEIFNLATAYFTWEEISSLIRDLTNSRSPIEVVPESEWRGAAFLADKWELSIEKARRLLNFNPQFTKEQTRDRLQQAMVKLLTEVKNN